MSASDAGEAKLVLRAQLLARRRAQPPGAEAAARLDALVADGDVIASYVSLRDEPATADFHRRCATRGVRVLLPRLLADHGLELAEGPTEPGLRGTSAPTGPATAWTAPALIVVPALAVDRHGIRLGRGGGSYDRALRLVPTGVPIVALLADEAEVVPELPAEPHDVPVTHAVTPAGMLLLPAEWHN